MARGQKAQAPAHAVDERNLHRRMMRRILPSLLVCSVVSDLDRVDAGCPALTMNAHLGLPATSFGIARFLPVGAVLMPAFGRQVRRDAVPAAIPA